MNKTSTLIVLALVAFSQFFSCNAEHDCEGVTVGECLIPPEDVIQTVDIFTEVEDCQFYCNALTNCELFRFDGQNCTIMTKDYRKDCQIVAGPFDKQISKCFEIEDKQVCDLFLQEDCGYTGEVLLEPPVGTIADPKECEELCDQFTAIGCKYWVYSQTEKRCTLRKEETRDCKTWGGPRSPLFDDCMSGSSTIPPSTTSQDFDPSTTIKDETTTSSAKTTAPTTLVPTSVVTTDINTITTIHDDTTTEFVSTTQEDDTTTSKMETTTPKITTTTAEATTTTYVCPKTTWSGESDLLLGPENIALPPKWEYKQEGKIISQYNNNAVGSIVLNQEAVLDVNYNGTFRVGNNPDNDWVGFVFGYHNVSDFYVVLGPSYWHHKITNDSHTDHWRIVKVNSMTGSIDNAMDEAIAHRNCTDEPVDGQTTVLWVDSVDRGWEVDTDFQWFLVYSPTIGEINVNICFPDGECVDSGIIHTEPSTTAGKLGVYVKSQENVTWFNMEYECKDIKPSNHLRFESKETIILGPQEYCCNDNSCNDMYYCVDWKFFNYNGLQDNEVLEQRNNSELATIAVTEEFISGGVDFSGKFNTSSLDDDRIGFVFGYQDTSNFYVVLGSKFNDSKNDNRQNMDHWRLTKVMSTTGIETSEMSEAISYQDTSVDGQTEVLWKDDQNRGWFSHKEYRWVVKYRPFEELASVWIGDLYEDGSCCRDIFDTGLIKIEGAANEAKLGVFVSSQPRTFWYDMFIDKNDGIISFD